VTEHTDMTALKTALTRIEKKLDTLDSIKGAYMAECKSVREAIQEEYRIAKDKGVMTRALKELIKVRQLQQSIDARISLLDDEVQEEYQAYADAVAGWEGTPLGDLKAA